MKGITKVGIKGRTAKIETFNWDEGEENALAIAMALQRAQAEIPN